MKLYGSIILWCLTTSVVMGQEMPLWHDIENHDFYVSVQGHFNARSAWDVNLVNAPIMTYGNRPKDMDIAKEILDALNDEFHPVLQRVLHGFGMKRISHKESDFKKWKKKAEPIDDGEGDRYFQIDVRVNGDNGLGGHYGGLDLRVTFKSLHRNPDLVYGFAFEALTIGAAADETLSNLETLLVQLVHDAVLDWRRAVKEEKRRPRKFLFLKFDTENLDDHQGAYVHQKLLDCLFYQGRSSSYIGNDREEETYRIYYQLKQNDPDETENDFIDWYADVLLFAMGSHGKFPCSLRNTPLEDYQPAISKNYDTKTITVRWNPPKKN
ncbi:hypothetical protein HUU42_08535 [bacterium]|nr:hypothetical protein [bacterium]